MSSATYLISTETLKTVIKGAVGSMTFGAYHQFNTNKIMELNNEMMKLQTKQEIEKMEIKQKEEIKQIRDDMRKEMWGEIAKIKEQNNNKWW